MPFWVTAYTVQFVIIIANINMLTAPGFNAHFVVKDSNQNVVQEETVTGGQIPAYSETTVSTAIGFTPISAGVFNISVAIEMLNMTDIDPSNNSGTTQLTVYEPPPGCVLFEGFGLSQVDFTFEGYEQENSNYGWTYLDFMMLPELCPPSVGYFNFATDMGWVVQNMPYDLESGLDGLGTFFELGGFTDITTLDGFAHISETPLLEFDFQPITTFDVGSISYNSQGRNTPIGTIPAPMRHEDIPFVEGGTDDLVWQSRHPSIEQDKNQCGPAALANSLQWLEDDQDIDVPDEHKKGIRDNSLVGKIDVASNRAAHATVSDANMLNGKIKYIDENGLGDDLHVKHKNRPGTTFVSNDTVKVGNTSSIPNTDATKSLVDWIIQELKDGEDVELGIGWDSGGGHWVDVVAGGKVQGVPWLAWVHDANQGFDGKGTATTDDDTTKANGGTSAASGGVGWSYIINNKMVSVVGTDTSKGTIDLAFSESKKEAPPVGFNENNKLPTDYSLSQNYPNPFNPTTVIVYSLPTSGIVKLFVYDVLGNVVAELVNSVQQAGEYNIEFDAQNLSSGVYFYKMEVGNFSKTKKLILMK